MSHHTHQTRFSDSSLYDIRCVLCGATDERGSSALDRPCPEYRCEEEATVPPVVEAATDACPGSSFQRPGDLLVRCGITSNDAAIMLDTVADRLPSKTELVDAVVSKVLAELRRNEIEDVVVAKEEMLERALRSALAGVAGMLPEGLLVVPAEPHPHDLSYAVGLSDLGDVSAHPPSRESTERELKAFYKTMVSRGAMRVR